jgi:hypothetical protein
MGAKLVKRMNHSLQLFDPTDAFYAGLDEDGMQDIVIALAESLDFDFEKDSLRQKSQVSSSEKDKLFNRRLQKLNEISSEIRRFENLIKMNANCVDNMIVPQLRAVSQTFNDHRVKYKKLKQVRHALGSKESQTRHLIEKKQVEMERRLEDRDNSSKISLIEGEIQNMVQRLRKEEKGQKAHQENGQQLEREYRRAQQTLNLKQREVLQVLQQLQSGEEGDGEDNPSMKFKQDQSQKRARKKLAEVGEHVAETMRQLEQSEARMRDLSVRIKEAVESYEHAQQTLSSKVESPRSQLQHSTLNNEDHKFCKPPSPIKGQKENQPLLHHHQRHRTIEPSDQEVFARNPN